MAVKAAGVVESAKSTNYKEYSSLAGRLNGTAALMSVNVATGVDSIVWNLGFDDLMSYKIEDEPLVKINEIYATKDAHALVDPPKEELMKLICDGEKIQPYKTLSDYHNAYRSKVTTPTEVCTKLVQIMESDEIKNLNAIIEVHTEEIVQAAKESTERFEKDAPLSVIDGIPFFVKDEIDIAGYHIYFGSPSMLDKHCVATCTVVKKLLEAGAILIGTANMVFAGLNVIGYNPSKVHGPVKNPYNTKYYCGGSSNGSAAVVSSGLVPFSIGLDGLGSNRIPPAFTGVVGMRGTTFRVSNGGTKYESSNSIVIGAITTNVRDHAIIYGVIAGPDDLHPSTLYQPSVSLPNFKYSPSELASKIKIGYDSSLTNLAHDKSIVSAVESTIQRLKDIGFTVVDYCIPEMHEIASATRVFFLKDAATNMAKVLGKNAANASFACCNATLLNSLGHDITAKEYDQALRQRKRAQLIAKDMFSKFDVFISPTTGLLAQKIIDGDDTHGVLDDVATARISLYVPLSSATGIPALSVPIGTTTEENLPIAIQLQASWWKEDVLYELGHLIESFLPAEKRHPQILLRTLDSRFVELTDLLMLKP